MLRLLALACAAAVILVGLRSHGIVDVGYAVMEGATAIAHGLLPYGNVPWIFHGDTYPIGSYLLYTPLALVGGVSGPGDPHAAAALFVAVLAALAVAALLWRATWGGARADGRRDEAGGLRAAIAWLSFPPLLATVTTGTSDVALAAFLLAALVLWRRPAIATSLLAAGGWFKVYPAALLGLALAPLRGARLLAALGGGIMVSLAMVAVLLGLGGPGAVGAMLHAIGYQLGRQTPQSLWSLVGFWPWQRLAQAAVLALVAAAAVRLGRDRTLAGDRARTAALCGAVLIALQLCAGYWSYLYLAWALPFLVVSVL